MGIKFKFQIIKGLSRSLMVTVTETVGNLPSQKEARSGALEGKLSRCVWWHIHLCHVAQHAANAVLVWCSKSCVRMAASQLLRNTALVNPAA